MYDATAANASPDRSDHERLRVGYISWFDPSDRNALSGMPASAWEALSRKGVELVLLSPKLSPGFFSHSLLSPARGAFKGMTTAPVRNAVRKAAQRIGERVLRRNTYKTVLRRAERWSREVGELAGRQEFDILFGICVSTLLYRLETTVPIVYCSDATARLINETYPDFSRRGKGYRRACDELEQTGLGRAAVATFPSQATLESAITDYGLPRERARLLPFGCNVVPENGRDIETTPPSRDDLRLVLVGGDPVRKRLGFCIDLTERLVSRGWNARLYHIGQPQRRALRSPLVESLGQLRLSSPEDRRLHRDVLRRSHLMVLPSTGEMYGMAPGEAAHFGIPSVVTAVGGLPTAVHHNRSGLVLPASASVADWTRAVEELCSDPASYSRMACYARERAQRELTWDAWAQGIVDIFRRVLAEGRQEGS